MDYADLDYPEEAAGDIVVAAHDHYRCNKYDVNCQECTGMPVTYERADETIGRK